MIIVTGATGLVGGHLLFHLLQKKQKVRALIRRQSNPTKVLDVWNYLHPNPEDLMSDVDWYPLDFDDPLELTDAFTGVKQVYHCAARVSFDSRFKKAMWMANMELTRKVVNLCLENSVDKLLYLSSVAAIATPEDNGITTEVCGWPREPKSDYSKTKTLAELEVWRGIAEGLNAVIINPTVILGSGNWQQSSLRIFDVAAKGLRYTTQGATGFVDVRDVIAISLQLMDSTISGERFILNSKNLEYFELFSLLAQALHRKVPKAMISPWLTQLLWRAEWIWSRLSGQEARITKHSTQAANRRREYSAEKVMKMLNYRFIPIETTIMECAAHYMAD